MQAIDIASRALKSNIVPAKDGPLFCCGPSHFHFFWLRDFSFSVPGLLLIGEAETVKRHLERSLDHVRGDGLMPRSFDVIEPKLRVVLGLVGIHASKIWPYTDRDLKPEYVGENMTIAADSNVLILDACLRYAEFTGDFEFLRAREPQLRQAFAGILRLRRGDLLHQPGFSDWQDSARRKGHTFYLNLLFYRLVQDLKRLGLNWGEVDAEAWLENLWMGFYAPATGLFLSELSDTSKSRLSLEGNLWAIEGDYFSKYIARDKLWANLKASALWNPLVGTPVAPNYPWRDISWTTKVVGLRHYHDGFLWSWLMGEALRVCCKVGDRHEADRLAQAIEEVVQRDQTVYEIYEWKHARKSENLVPAKTLFYRSEYDFSWGAAKVIEGLSAHRLSKKTTDIQPTI
jgi:hypothetical protein